MFEQSLKAITNVFLVITLWSCSALEKHVKAPSVQFAGSQIESASLYDANVNFILRVDNPNAVSIPLQGIKYTLNINGIKMLSGTTQHGASIPAQGSTDLLIPTTIRYEDFLESLHQLISNDAFDYALSGEVDLGIINIPYSASGSMKLPKLPKVALRDIKITHFGLDGIKTVMHVGISNSNDFPINFNGLSYQLQLNQQSTLVGKSVQAIDTQANGETTIEVASEFSFRELGQVLDAIRREQKIQASFNGELSMQSVGGTSKKLPFTWSGETPLLR